VSLSLKAFNAAKTSEDKHQNKYEYLGLIYQKIHLKESLATDAHEYFVAP